MRFDPTQTGLFLFNGRLDLGLAHPQHPSQLIDTQFLAKDPPDLIEIEPQVAKRHQAM
jgi:hypothetical protein